MPTLRMWEENENMSEVIDNVSFSGKEHQNASTSFPIWYWSWIQHTTKWLGCWMALHFNFHTMTIIVLLLWLLHVLPINICIKIYVWALTLLRADPIFICLSMNLGLFWRISYLFLSYSFGISVVWGHWKREILMNLTENWKIQSR